MKIVEIIPSFLPLNGAERFVLDLSLSLSSCNEIYIISLYGNHFEIPNELKENKNVKFVFLSKSKGLDLSCAKELKNTIKTIEPDFIHAHLDSLLTIWLSKIYKKYNIFYTIHTLISSKVIGSKLKPKNLLYRHLFKNCYIFPIAISNKIRNSVCSYYGLKAQNVPVVCNGVPTERFFCEKSYDCRKYDFIFIGRFIELKNPLAIVKAFLLLKEKFPNIKMVMSGEGPLLDECKSQSNGKIIFTGYTKNVSDLLKESKSLVMASRYEGNPMVVNEGISSKCFIIASNAGGIPDVVNQNNGYLYYYNNNFCDNLYNSMKVFLENIEYYDKLTSENYFSNMNRVSIKKCSNSYLNVFKGAKL